MMKKLLKLLLWSIGVIIVVPVLACIALWQGIVLYGNWVDNQEINALTASHGEELFKVVQSVESGYTLTGYADEEEFCRYIPKSKLQICQREWEALHSGESETVWVTTQLVSPQVVTYTDGLAELMVKRYQKEVKYGPAGPEIISSTDRVFMASYTLIFEDNRWKVGLVDVCGADDRKCIRQMKHIERQWYHLE
ncbi:MAG: hypothetical protein U0401_12745 [Anaerolineae bacterium]